MNPPRLQARVSDRRLTERDAAIVRRHAMMCEDLEAISYEHPAGLFKEQQVLKDAAR